MIRRRRYEVVHTAVGFVVGRLRRPTPTGQALRKYTRGLRDADPCLSSQVLSSVRIGIHNHSLILTTALVATGHGRDCILIDLDERNYELALQRVGPFILERAG